MHRLTRYSRWAPRDLGTRLWAACGLPSMTWGRCARAALPTGRTSECVISATSVDRNTVCVRNGHYDRPVISAQPTRARMIIDGAWPPKPFLHNGVLCPSGRKERMTIGGSEDQGCPSEGIALANLYAWATNG
jgi:hypothetical protein